MEALLHNRPTLSDEKHAWRCAYSEELIFDLIEKANEAMEVKVDTPLIPLEGAPARSTMISPTLPMET
ncbi:MAG: hypothetical protein ACKPKO_42035 [Candidatus Fonsibacter sp.]